MPDALDNRYSHYTPDQLDRWLRAATRFMLPPVAVLPYASPAGTIWRVVMLDGDAVFGFADMGGAPVRTLGRAATFRSPDDALVVAEQLRAHCLGTMEWCPYCNRRVGVAHAGLKRCPDCRKTWNKE